MFSKACEYGIRASIYVAKQSREGRRVNLGAISRQIGSPAAFTAKILQLLAKNGIVKSVKGPAGGFEIDRKKMSRISLSHIVTAIDGDTIYTGCGLGLKECSARHPCPVHDKFKKIRNDLKRMLESTNLEELSTGNKKGEIFLKAGRN